MKSSSHLDNTAALFRAISQPVRLEILLAIGTGEACVCHLEAVIGKRQAYISQQLMALRAAGIVTSRREGRNIFYRVIDLKILEMIQAAGAINDQEADGFLIQPPLILQEDCPCPKCAGDVDEAVSPSPARGEDISNYLVVDTQHD
jgi:DNA-binding transcriptional ArsR family regulator